MSSLIILALAGFLISCGKTDRQTDRQTNAAENIPRYYVGVRNK